MSGIADPTVLVLDGPASLATLNRRGLRASIRRIALADAERLPDGAHLERQINRWFFACGCEQGSFTVLLVAAGSITAGLWHGFDGPLAWWRVVAYVAAAALVGKVAGIAHARLRVRRVRRRLLIAWGSREAAGWPQRAADGTP